MLFTKKQNRNTEDIEDKWQDLKREMIEPTKNIPIKEKPEER